MIQGQIALIRRELWEHRAIYVAPLVIALLVSLMSITGQVAVSGFDHAVDIGILGATNLGENERSAALTVLMISLSSTFVFAMWILTIFYSLDALYAERKDRSILFWRSIPLTDFETVFSKLLTALVVIPLITFAVIAATHLIVLLITSMWLGARSKELPHDSWSDCTDPARALGASGNLCCAPRYCTSGVSDVDHRPGRRIRLRSCGGHRHTWCNESWGK